MAPDVTEPSASDRRQDILATIIVACCWWLDRVVFNFNFFDITGHLTSRL